MWENLRARFGRMGLLLFVGLIVLFGLALAIFAVQQGARQSELKAQIDKISLTLVRPLPSAATLKAEYDEATLAVPRLFTGPLGPWWGLQHEAANPSAIQLPEREAVDIIVRLARDSGIDIDPASGMLTIPPNSPPGNAKVGDGNYGVLSINNIQAIGDYDKVVTFIARLESGAALKTMVLRNATLSWVEVPDKKDAARADELKRVQDAVTKMMTDNGLTNGIMNAITGPISTIPVDAHNLYAVNLMGDDPLTDAMEGFPDISTLAGSEFKLYTGDPPNPRNGYVLYRHHRIDKLDTARYTTINYFPNDEEGADWNPEEARTNYYYTIKVYAVINPDSSVSYYNKGEVRQFDGPDTATAKEYGPDIKKVTLTAAAINVDIIIKPLPKPEAKPEAKPK